MLSACLVTKKTVNIELLFQDKLYFPLKIKGGASTIFSAAVSKAVHKETFLQLSLEVHIFLGGLYRKTTLHTHSVLTE